MAGRVLGDDLLGRIHHGDCVAGMNALKAGSVDLVFADWTLGREEIGILNDIGARHLIFTAHDYVLPRDKGC